MSVADPAMKFYTFETAKKTVMKNNSGLSKAGKVYTSETQKESQKSATDKKPSKG